MLALTEERIGKIKYSNIAITRGDGTTLVLPIYLNQNGTRTAYTPQVGDTFALQVREAPVTKSNPTPALIFTGTLAVVNDKVEWTISESDTTIDCKKYYWDCQITTGGVPFTFYCGWLEILGEATIPTTP